MGYMMAIKHLEINPDHPIVETLWQKVEAEGLLEARVDYRVNSGPAWDS